MPVAELEQVVSPERPHDDSAREPGGERGEQHGDDDAEVELSVLDRPVGPGETHHAAPERRRQIIPPMSSAKAAIGSMTNAAVNNVTLSRMVFSGPPTPAFRKACAGPAAGESTLEFKSLRPSTGTETGGLVRTCSPSLNEIWPRWLVPRITPCAEDPGHRTLPFQGHRSNSVAHGPRRGSSPVELTGMTPSLFIVSVYRPDLYEAALAAVGLARDVEVVLDRRVGERRGPGRPGQDDADLSDRRRLAIDEQLRADGWALVSADARSASADIR